MIEAHGRALRLVAEEAGVHFQGLAALAGHLRRQGCSDRRLLRRLSALDAAAGVIRHITVVSVDEMEMDIKRALLHLHQQDQVEMQPVESVINPVFETEVVTQQDAQVTPTVEQEMGSQTGKGKGVRFHLPEVDLPAVQYPSQQVTPAGAPELVFTGDFATVAPQVEPTLDRADVLEDSAEFRLGGRGPNPPWEGQNAHGIFQQQEIFHLHHQPQVAPQYPQLFTGIQYLLNRWFPLEHLLGWSCRSLRRSLGGSPTWACWM